MVQALAIVAALAFSGLGAYFLFVRNLSIEDVGRTVIDDPSSASPGFRHSLAGKHAIVEGTVTNITSRSTTIGILSMVELDGFAYMPLVEWGVPDYAIGDRIEKKITFEWSNCNNERHVYSPQLAFPTLQVIPSVEIVVRATNYVSDAVDLISSQLENGDIRIDVPYVRDPVPLARSNCTLKAGDHSWAGEYMDVLGFYPNNNITDQITDLEEEVGTNGIIHFLDANSDHYLDSGDCFILKNLTRPSTDSGMNTYYLTVGWPIEPEMPTYSWGFSCSYMPLIKKGLVIYDRGDTPGARMIASSADSGFQYTVRNIEGFAPDWGNVSLGISSQSPWWDWIELNISRSLLMGHSMANEGLDTVSIGDVTLETSVLDVLGDGFINEGDSVTVTPSSGNFPANSSYEVWLTYKPMGSRMWSTNLVPNATPICRPDVGSVQSGFNIGFDPVHTGFNMTYVPFDLPWKEVVIILSDGNASVNWTLGPGLLSSGAGEHVSLSPLTLGGLTVVCNATDLEGNSLINRGDSIEITTTGTERFSIDTQYTIRITYEPASSLMCSATFDG
jgi:hypothetical protein